MKIDQLKKISEIASAWVTIVGLAAAGAWALHEYRTQVQKSQVERVLSYAAKLHSPEYLASRAKLFGALEKQRADVVAELRDESRSMDERTKLYFARIVRTVEQEGLVPSFLELENFFEQIALCVRQRICDEMAAKTFFSVEGRAFFRTWAPYFCHLRRVWNIPSFGSELESFFNPEAAGSACADRAA